ncbi:type IV pilin-like G/H family protein [Microcoleus sp. herbarium12]|uniref:type IV pilin-like G/H family protein n=1 Tax=Microcoleus sp. herbarium12 TaxID=3055437 RepID=UPI002FCFB566
MTYSSRNQQIKVALATLILPVLFPTAAHAQLSPTLQPQELAAKQYVIEMNKAQQDYYQNNTGFTSSVSNLALGIKAGTANYKYSIDTANKAVFNYAVSDRANLKNFVGGVFLIGNKTTTILCLNVASGKIKPAKPTMDTKGVVACGANTAKVAQ